jgi:hypothetical protein
MRTKVHFLSFDQILSTLRTLQFDVQGVPGVANQVLVTKYGAGAVLIHAPDPEGEAKKVPQIAIRWRERPGYMVGGGGSYPARPWVPEVLENQQARNTGDGSFLASRPSLCRGVAGGCRRTESL